MGPLSPYSRRLVHTVAEDADVLGEHRDAFLKTVIFR